MTFQLEIALPDNATPEMALRIKLRAARLLAELSQEELGRLIGVHHNYPAVQKQTVSRWERTGNIPASVLGAIAAACNVPFEFFRV